MWRFDTQLPISRDQQILHAQKWKKEAILAICVKVKSIFMTTAGRPQQQGNTSKVPDKGRQVESVPGRKTFTARDRDTTFK